MLLAQDAEDDVVLPRVPVALRFEHVAPVWLKRAGAFSLATLPFSVAFGAPLWLAWLAILAPWFAIIALETRAKYGRHPLFACFGLLVILQTLHMVEHSTQVTQLLLTGGALAKSHGVIGQLDFESTHFVADVVLWLTVGWLAIKSLAPTSGCGSRSPRPASTRSSTCTCSGCTPPTAPSTCRAVPPGSWATTG